MSALSNALTQGPSIVIWCGASGTKYEFHRHEIGTVFRPFGGVYVFSRLWGLLHQPLYVGETDNFARRLTNELACHHQWPSLAHLGVTHVSTLPVLGGVAERLRIETDLPITGSALEVAELSLAYYETLLQEAQELA